MTRTDAREVLMQAVFQMEMQQSKDQELLKQFLASKKVSADQEGYILSSFDTIMIHLDEIDEQINTYSKSFKTNRMAKVDLAILRVAIGEIMFIEDTPSAVAINEAVKMAKKYADEKSKKFINGVLGSVERNLNEK